MKEYVENMTKYVENMKRYAENIYEKSMGLRKILELPTSI